MQNPIHTHQTRQGYGDSVILAHCRLCDDTIVSVQYTHEEAADEGRLHVQNTHTSVRWQLLPNGTTEGLLAGIGSYAQVMRHPDGWYWWDIYSASHNHLEGSTATTKNEAILLAEARLLNDPR